MADFQDPFYVRISIGDLLTGNENVSRHDFSCYIFLNNDPVHKLIFDPESIAPILFSHPEDKIEFIFKKIDKPEIFGCVSMYARTFVPYIGQKISQWITLFDSPDDDEFDGEIGVNDEEFPKALIYFNITDNNNSNQFILDQIREPEESRLPLPEKEPQRPESNIDQQEIYTGQKRKISDNMMKGENRPMTPTSSLSSLRKPGTSIIDSTNKASALPRTNPTTETFVANGKLVSAIFGNQPGNITEDHQGFQEKLNQVLKNLKASSLQSTNINKNMLPEEFRYTENDIRQITGQYEEKLKLYNLEIQKNKDVEIENAKLKRTIDENNSKFEEKEQKMITQFKQSLDRNKELNNENFTLKQRISDLERELFQTKESLTEELKFTTQSALKQAEYDKAIIEKLNLRIQNLEKLNTDLHEQADKNDLSYRRELEKNKKVTEAQNDLLVKYKKVIDDAQSLQKNLEQKLKGVDQERVVLEDALQARTNELQKHVLRISSLEMDLATLKATNERLIKEAEEHRQHNAMLRNSINDLLKDKETEIGNIRDALNKSNDKINEIYSDYGKLQREKDYIYNEYKQLCSRGYDSEIGDLEKRLQISEASRRILQNELNEAHKQWEIVYDTYDKNIHTEISKETVTELEGKIKQLIEQFQIQMAEYDKLKFENNQLINMTEELKHSNELCQDYKTQIHSLRKAHEDTKQDHAETKKALFKAGHELIKQVTMNATHDDAVQKLQTNLELLAADLTQAVNDNQRLQRELYTLQKTTDIPFEPYIPKKNDEIDICLAEFINKNRIPIKFIRISEGLYAIGSKKIFVRIMNGKLVVRIGGGYMMLEEFIKLYASQEIIKLRIMKNLPVQLTELELDELPPEVRSQIIKEEEKDQMIIKEIETNGLNDIKVIPGQNTTSGASPNSRKSSPVRMTGRQSTLKKVGYSTKSPSGIKTENERNITPKKKEIYHSSTSMPVDDADMQTAEVYDISPMNSGNSSRKKTKSGKDIQQERGIGGVSGVSNKAYTQQDMGMTSMGIAANYGSQKSPKEKDRSPWRTNSAVFRKDTSPAGKRNTYTGKQINHE